MKRFKFTAILLSVATLFGYQQARAKGNGVITSTTSDGKTIVVTAINDNIVRVANFPKGEKTRASMSVVLDRQPFNGDIAENGSRDVTMTLPSGLKVTVNPLSGAVEFRSGGALLLRDSGVRSAEAGKRVTSLSTAGAGVFYGTGERGHSFKLNGDSLVMYNRQNYGYTEGDPRISQMNICIPYFVSTEGYGVMFDDYAAATLILENPIKYITESREPVAYYFIYGGDVAGVTSQYTLLTGRQELPPFWALGYITSKYGYKTQAETEGVIDTLKRDGYPVDGVVLDLYWYGQETDMGRLEWNSDQWPDHKKMLADLKKRGVNTVIISQPYINKIGAFDNYNELASKGLLTKNAEGEINDVTTWVGEAGMFDVANPDTRRWLRERYRQLTDDGVTGWWGDLGEPEVHPESIVHANGETTREYHNVYGNEWSRIIHDLFKDEYPDTRLMTLMRGGTAGLQRFSVFPWSTDVSRSWGGMQPQVKIMLNSGLSGLGYMSHDVGGFAIDEARPTDAELYVRWLQLGVFSPILRTHAQQFAEPYHYPQYAGQLQELVKMRYRWLPYNYTLAYENAVKGYPLVRPLNFNGEAPAWADSVTDEYMWGSEVLVAPVLEEGAVSRDVRLPSGIWIDWNNPGVDYLGPAEFTYHAPLEVMPLFVRNGAFIPQADYAMENTGDYNPAELTVLYYPRGEVASSYVLYDDNRLSTNSLATGEYCLVTFKGDAVKGKITVDVTSEGYYDGMPQQRELTFILPGLAEKCGAVSVNGVKATSSVVNGSDYKFTVTLTPSSPLKIEITTK